MGGSRRNRAGAWSGAVAAATAGLPCLPGAPRPRRVDSDSDPDADRERGCRRPGADPAEVAAIQEAVETTMEANNVRAAIVRVMRGDEVVLMQAWGESMAEVPATTDMHFRSGAVSIPMVSTVLLQLVDEGTVALDDKLAEWLPDVPNADKVTLGQLAQMTSGYADYVQDATFLARLQREPVAPVDTRGALHVRHQPAAHLRARHQLGLRAHELRAAHARAREDHRAVDDRGDPGAHLRSARMQQTADPGTPEILQPVLHAFDSERREYLQIGEGLPYIEDSTYWNPSWSLGPGSMQNTDITDMATVIRAVGRGDLLSEESLELMIAPTLRGKTTTVEGCPTCFPQGEFYTYGLGIVLSGDWLLQNPAESRLRRRHRLPAVGGRQDRDRGHLRRRCVRPQHGSTVLLEYREPAVQRGGDRGRTGCLDSWHLRALRVSAHVADQSLEVSWPFGTIAMTPPSTMRQRMRIASPNSSPSSCTGCAGEVATSRPFPRA